MRRSSARVTGSPFTRATTASVVLALHRSPRARRGRAPEAAHSDPIGCPRRAEVLFMRVSEITLSSLVPPARGRDERDTLRQDRRAEVADGTGAGAAIEARTPRRDARHPEERRHRSRDAPGAHRRDVPEARDAGAEPGPGTGQATPESETRVVAPHGHRAASGDVLRRRAVDRDEHLGLVERRPLELHPRIGEGEEELHERVLRVLQRVAVRKRVPA